MTIRERVESAAVDELPELAAEIEAGRVALEIKLKTLAAVERKAAEANLIDDTRAAEITGTSRRWLNAETAGMSFRRDLSRKQKRYEEAGLRAWYASR